MQSTQNLIWKEVELPLAVAAERKQSLTYYPSKVRPVTSTAHTKDFSSDACSDHPWYVKLMGLATSIRALLLLQAVQNNGTLYAHAVFRPTGLSLNPTDPEYYGGAVLVSTHCECLSCSSTNGKLISSIQTSGSQQRFCESRG